MAEYTGGSVEADHLCVLVHGLWGTPDHMASIAAALRAQYPEDKLHLLVAKSNSGLFTYDGIETGGERVCDEIEAALADVTARGGGIARLSVIGYSLGGLIARYAVGLLYARGTLDKLACLNFTAFASPFLGVRSPRGGMGAVWNALGGRILSMSGRQLFGIDSFRDTGRPLLAILADPESIFMAGLARFRRRTLYANIVNDLSAVHYTTAITKTDPYGAVRGDGGDLDDLPLHFVPGYDDVILDREEPIAWHRHHVLFEQRLQEMEDLEQGSQQERRERQERRQLFPRRPRKRSHAVRVLQAGLASPWSKEARAVLLDVAPMVAVALLLPVGVTAFLAHSAYETVQSSRRRKLHEGGLAGIDVRQYRVPLWVKGLQELQGTAEGAFESLNSAHEPDYLADSTTEDDEIDAQLAYENHSRPTTAATATTADSALSATSAAASTRPRRKSVAELDAEAAQYRKTLALSSDQFAMIEALDSLGWRKYPVWIHKIRHSHAAIIRRRQEPKYDEGKIVLRHFIQEEFLAQ